MVFDLLLGSMLSSIAGLSLALVTAAVTDHRENRRWLQTKVHQPLYGELTNVISGETPWAETDYVSTWADLDYYKAYRVDVELAETLDRYTSRMGELASLERDADLDAFVDALPETVDQGGDGVAELPTGRRLDLRTWLRRNLLVLAADPAFRPDGDGGMPGDLDYLWEEVDGVPEMVDTDGYDTQTALAAVSTEFNWGYEGFYHEWPAGWATAMVVALDTAADRRESTITELVARRRALGKLASDARALIEIRAERGLYRSLWHATMGG